MEFKNIEVSHMQWSRCTSGIGGCGDGSLPCERLDDFVKEDK